MIHYPHSPGARLRSLRRKHFKSQQAFANHCQNLGIPITRNQMANWEISRTNVPAQFLPLLAHALRVKVTDLLPDLRPAAATALPTKPSVASISKNARDSRMIAGWFSLKNLVVNKVLAPVWARFQVQSPDRLSRFKSAGEAGKD